MRQREAAPLAGAREARAAGAPLHQRARHAALRHGRLRLLRFAFHYKLARVEAGTLRRGTAFRLYLCSHGILRVLLDPLRADGRPERLFGLSPQQGLALLVIAIALVW